MHVLMFSKFTLLVSEHVINVTLTFHSFLIFSLTNKVQNKISFSCSCTFSFEMHVRVRPLFGKDGEERK